MLLEKKKKTKPEFLISYVSKAYFIRVTQAVLLEAMIVNILNLPWGLQERGGEASSVYPRLAFHSLCS